MLRALLMHSTAFRTLFGCSYAWWRFPQEVIEALGFNNRRGFAGASYWMRRILAAAGIRPRACPRRCHGDRAPRSACDRLQAGSNARRDPARRSAGRGNLFSREAAA